MSKREKHKTVAVKSAEVQDVEKITFDMYCARKKVVPRHRAGLRAFTKVVRASFDEWEHIFARY